MPACLLRIGEHGLIREARGLYPDAAFPRYRVENDAHRVVPETSDDTADQLLVHVADEIAVLLRERMERTVPEAHAPPPVLIRLVASLLEDIGRDRDRSLGSRARDPASFSLRSPDLDARIACCTKSCLVAGLSLILRAERPEQDRSEQVVPALRERDVELAIRRLVVLRGPAGSPATSTRWACVREREEPAIDQLVQVERRELAGDPCRGGGFLSGHWPTGSAYVEVELAPEVVSERTQRRSIPSQTQHPTHIIPTASGDTPEYVESSKEKPELFSGTGLTLNLPRA